MYVSEAVDCKVIICLTWHLYDAGKKNCFLTYAHPNNNNNNKNTKGNK